MLPRERVRLEVTLEMDPIPGSFHTADSCEEHVRRMLQEMIPHYRPHVRIDDTQPVVFDPECPDCDFQRHRCHFCGDTQDHSGASLHDGHTTRDCAESME